MVGGVVLLRTYERTFCVSLLFCVLDNNIRDLIVCWSVAYILVRSKCNIATKKHFEEDLQVGVTLLRGRIFGRIICI
jgi:hypothetical protein